MTHEREPDSPKPPIVDRSTWQTALDTLRAEEKSLTRAADVLAAKRRRLPMVEIDANTPLDGIEGPATLLEAFDGRRQLVAYFHMWQTGKPASRQCEGCTFFTTHISELSYLNSRDVSYATFCDGPIEESARYRDFMGWSMPWFAVPAGSQHGLLAGRQFGFLSTFFRDGDRVFETYWTTGRGVEVMVNSYSLLDLTLYGRQEYWEDSPDDWPKRWGVEGGQFRLDGRPTSQWSRIREGRDDSLA